MSRKKHPGLGSLPKAGKHAGSPGKPSRLTPYPSNTFSGRPLNEHGDPNRPHK